MTDSDKDHKPTRKDDLGSQADRFKSAARELQCDENEAGFFAAVARVGKSKPKKQVALRKG